MSYLKAIRLAKEAHFGQIDKCGMSLWLHPYRVGLACHKYGYNVMSVGFLHDIIEDTSITLTQLRYLGFSEIVINAVDAISRKAGESYRIYILRVEENPIATLVKIADLMDNLRYDRLPSDGYIKTLKRRKMYSKYLRILREVNAKNNEGE